MGNTYSVDQALAGRKVELVFDPFDLTTIEVRHRGQPFGAAAPFTIGRHSHPKAKPEQPGTAPEPTGISYLNLISAAHDSQLGERINYAALLGGTGQLPGQMTIDGALGEQP
ncbi:MAG: Mu transposase C-terminal domain-containing protein [Streptosporangiaceae bacterium]